MKHASRGTYTLHSLYLLLWANFGAFCIALLTQPDSDDKIHGNLISDWISVRHYCVSQLRTLWMHMRNNLSLSEEERTFFVMRTMKKFYEVWYYQYVCIYNEYRKDAWIKVMKFHNTACFESSRGHTLSQGSEAGLHRFPLHQGLLQD